MRGKREPLDGFSPRKLRNYYLLNPEEEGERHYKLILSQTDKDSLISIVGNREQPKEYSLRVMENFKLFESWIVGCKDNLTPLCKGLAKLIVVDIALNRDQDNPQLIFESMNSTGKELSQADLIRNFILMGLEPQLQTRLYEQFWRPMEVDFGQEAYSKHFDGFMRHYLTVKTGEIPRIGEVYEAFKVHASSHKDGTGRNGSTGSRHPDLFPLLLCHGARNRDRSRSETGFPRLTRAEGRCGLSIPARTVSRLRNRNAVQGRFCCSGSAGGSLRVPPCNLLYPHKLNEQDLCNSSPRLSRRIVTSKAFRHISFCCLRIAAFQTTRSSGVNCKPETSTTSEAAATGSDAWKTMDVKNVCR